MLTVRLCLLGSMETTHVYALTRWFGLNTFKCNPWVHAALGFLTWLDKRNMLSQITWFMGPTSGPSGADRTQVGSMLAPRTLLSGILCIIDMYRNNEWFVCRYGNFCTRAHFTVTSWCFEVDAIAVGMRFVFLVWIILGISSDVVLVTNASWLRKAIPG